MVRLWAPVFQLDGYGGGVHDFVAGGYGWGGIGQDAELGVGMFELLTAQPADAGLVDVYPFEGWEGADQGS